MNGQRLNARQSAALKAFQVDGYDDEFRISGRDDNSREADTAETEELFEDVPVAMPQSSFGDEYFFVFLAGLIIVLSALIGYKWRWSGKNVHGPKVDGKTKHAERRHDEISSGCKGEITDPKSSGKEMVSMTVNCVNQIKEKTKANSEQNALVVTASSLTKDTGTIVKRANSTPPELVLDQVSSVTSTLTVAKAVSNQLVAVPNQSVEEIKEEFQSEIISNAATFKQALRESGLGGSDEALSTLSLHAAITKRQTDAICQANFQAEMRSYHFHSQHKAVDREISERQHDEVLSSLKSDKDWLHKLLVARDDCFDALKMAITRSYTITLGFQPLLAGLRLLRTLNSSTYSAFFSTAMGKLSTCSQGDDAMPPSVTSPYGISRWAVLSIEAFLPGGSLDVVGSSLCAFYNLITFFSLGICMLLLSCMARAFGLPVVSASTAIALTLCSGLLPVTYALKVLVALAVIACSAACFVLFYYHSSRRSFQRESTPSVASLNRALDPFFLCKDVVRGLPFAVLLFHIAESTGLVKS